MFHTDWTEGDGYYECLVGLREGCALIFRARAVRQSNGSYAAIVRECQGRGPLLSFRNERENEDYNNLEYVKNLALQQVRNILKAAADDLF